ncbi:hypothetical protein J8J40_34425, partial [Mycobacterium tuberculosis]|nr:hypothetical protein [Mycobacterium tuberculosis]
MIDACRLRDTLKRATDAFLAVLDDTTLADLVGHGETVLAVLDRRRAAPGHAVTAWGTRVDPPVAVARVDGAR